MINKNESNPAQLPRNQDIDKLPKIKPWEILPETVGEYLKTVGDQQTTDAYLASRLKQEQNGGPDFDDVRWGQRYFAEIGEDPTAHARRVLWEEVFGVDVGTKLPDKRAVETIGGVVSHDWVDSPNPGSPLQKILDNPSLGLRDIADEKLTLAVTGTSAEISNAELIRLAWIKLSEELMRNSRGVPSEMSLPIDPSGPDGLLVILRTHPSLAPIFEHVSITTALK